ncbi:MAG TPA: hypothetical protein VFZ66_07480 [Herpetosiphonaceae bacterium]
MAQAQPNQLRRPISFTRRLNEAWHKPALMVFLVIVLAHWVEHLVQAYQVYGMHWPRSQAGGFLGLFFPWLVSSELLHYVYAIVMLIGFIWLRPGFVGQGRTWWNIALAIQIWHHFEHLLLLIQAALGTPFFGAAAPTSLLQLAFPRMELHLFYNAVVFAPMVIAMFYHSFPSADEAHRVKCSCALRKPALT